jgi:hypothetical protein
MGNQDTAPHKKFIEPAGKKRNKGTDLVHDRSTCALVAISDSNLLEAFRAGVTPTVLL